ncbi:MAG: hypothetical protein Q9187_006737 [Circinaria calcarea]
MPTATIVGISGCSSSGKTTLARLLRSLFPHTLILHQDDFYLPEAQLPLRSGLRDWDCAASLDIAGLVDALRYIKAEGKLPEGLVSKEDQNEVGANGVSERVERRLQGEVEEWMRGEGQGKLSAERRLVILDGFLLFGESVRDVREEIDVKVLLRAKYDKAKERREKRSGYVTLEGFWEDPPGYVDEVVWPNYVEEHGFLFEGGDVEGKVNEKVVSDLGIRVCPGEGEWSMEEVLVWAVEAVKEALSEDR